MTRESAISLATRHFDEGQFIEDLARRVAIRTESQIPESRPYMDVYLKDEITPAFTRMGFKTEILPNPVEGVGPILLAERIEGPHLPTVLMYGHGDVIRGLEDQWRAGIEPWMLKQEGDKYYGRGTADNKGQHSVNMAAMETVIAERGKLGFNVKFMLETGEELSSPGLQAFCEQHKARLKADVLIASDGPRLSAKRPTLYLGSRGCMNLNFTVELRAGAHHSGNWGGLLANPGIVLAHALASIVTREGQVLVRELMPQNIPNSIRKALRDCQPTPEPDEPQIDPWWGEPGLSAAEKLYAWNTFEILAFRTGNPDNPVNAIPGKAVATCQIRFVAGCDANTFIPILRKHLDANSYDCVKISMARKSFMQATRLDPDNAWVRWAAESIRRTTGAAPAILPNIGGSLPNDCFAETLGLPTLWVPHSYAGCSQHAPNEHALGSILREGLQMMTGLFWDLAEKEHSA
ncbi:MAG TPA: M20 family metallopeptidase, partial [Burkholderiales bacterium]|nr:M20 family metallopeptidase [Burkholderiales bacterium]